MKTASLKEIYFLVKRILVCLLLAVTSLILFNFAYSYTFSENFLKKRMPAENYKFALNYLELLYSRNYEKAEEEVAQQYRTPETRTYIRKIGEMLNAEPFTKPVLIGYTIHRGTHNDNFSEISFLLRHKDLWRTITIAASNKQGESEILGFRSEAIPKALLDENKWKLSNQSLIHYLMLFLTIAVSTFIFYVAGLCLKIKRERLRGKLLWLIFILFGFGKLSFNWTSAEITWSPYSLMLVGASAHKFVPFGPWILSISLPIGALTFIGKLRSIKKNESIQD